MTSRSEADIVVVGAGAAGLMAATWAARSRPDARVIALEGARSLGAKILVAGGGRCNVTHHAVDERAFAGSTSPAIRRVLRRFGVDETVEFFRELGVTLKREDTGKLFPTTDRARTVLDALLTGARDAGAEVQFPRRVETVRRDDGGFVVEGDWGTVHAERVILCAGGRSLPKSGSDGHGYTLARRLGHTTTERIFPALVALVVRDDCLVRGISGVATDATVQVRLGNGKRGVSFTNAVLCTHFGLSGPAILDVSRYLLDARADDPGARLLVSWIPEATVETVDQVLLDAPRSTPLKVLLSHGLPRRLAGALIDAAGVDPEARLGGMPRDQRRRLAQQVAEHDVPVTGDRGFTKAEVTAGGVPLRELHLSSLESRVCPRLYLAGEICDVDGRIGGFNFQWAWASGYVAGTSAGGR